MKPLLFSVLVLMLQLSGKIGHAQTLDQKPFLQFKNISGKRGAPGEWARYILQDSLGLMWFGTDIDFKYYDGYSYRKYALEEGDIMVTSMLEDHQHDIWVFASADALYHLDRKRDKVTRYEIAGEQKQTLNEVYPLIHLSRCLFEDHDNNLWLSTYQGFMQFDRETQQMKLISARHDRYLGWLIEDDQQRLWEVMSDGLGLFQDPDSLFIPFIDKRGEPQQLLGVNWIIPVESGNFWISTEYNGAYYVEASSGQITSYRHDPDDPHSLGWNKVNHIMEDDQNRVWLAADLDGINLHSSNNKGFHHYQPNFRNTDELSTYPTFLFQDRNQGFWVSNYSAGITYAGYFDKPFIAHKPRIGDPKSLDFPYVTNFFERPNGDIWITIDGGGLNLWHREKGEFSHFKHDPFNSNSLGYDKAFQVIESVEGDVWIRHGRGIDRMDANTGIFKHYPIYGVLHFVRENELWLMNENRRRLYQYNSSTDSFELKFEGMSDLYADREGNIWVKYPEGNWCRFNLENGRKSQCFEANGQEIAEDALGNFWILLGDQGDTLIKYNPTLQEYSDPLILQNSRDHLRNKLVIDDNNHIWLGTKDGLFRYKPASGELKHYDYSDGLSSEFLRTGSPLKTRKGELLFGSSNGFTIFHPDSIRENTFEPPVLITSFKIGGQEALVAGPDQDNKGNATLANHIHFVESIQLKHFQNDITFEFAALDYTNPEKNKYQYKLEGYDKHWTDTDAFRRIANYTNLPPGTYTFRVRGSNNDGTWNMEGDTLVLTITAPWYWSTWSKLLYLLIVLGIIYTLYHFQLRRQLAAAEAQRLQELDIVKTHLYTNITHEFRTPLTVISGMADQVLEDPAKWFREGLQMIKRNSRHLLKLVNQILDLAKLESGNLPVNMVQDDVIKFIKYLTESFHSYAETKDIRLHLLPEIEELYMDFDPEKVQAIFTNLVSNAIKFTPAGGDVYITIAGGQLPVDGDFLEICVKDNGIGIPTEQLPYIFDRFYQADNSSTREEEGTGIGLTLTRELVNLLGGKISVTSQPGKGTQFTVLLPVTSGAEKGRANANYQNDWNTETKTALLSISEMTFPDDSNPKPLVLLIEDNIDVLQYLAACLQDQYRLVITENGQEGIKQAIEQVPDIIISDVMMPVKDGFEVVKTLKQDERTSHVPIVLLTAKADMGSRLEGLEQGADAYLAKPFHKDELEVRLRKLIEVRERLQKHYRALAPTNEDAESSVDKEHAFLRKIRERIEARLSDENYGISELCADLAISRTQLHRKLKALTGKSTSFVIRTIRLQKAMELLENSDLNVSEIGYAVGFSNRSHFTTAFKEEFGKAPSFFRDENGSG
ncbi:hybrid sensor histidine kinase/response regulator transcription factor [Flavilitoribacter nigricans]|nr:hybrid sensor histidine kinase/response regulator transcription factor [Flavilitoribacter nigricans]